jgi:hypothetical protein
LKQAYCRAIVIEKMLRVRITAYQEIIFKKSGVDEFDPAANITDVLTAS